jgi:hypothetical protein
MEIQNVSQPSQSKAIDAPLPQLRPRRFSQLPILLHLLPFASVWS